MVKSIQQIKYSSFQWVAFKVLLFHHKWISPEVKKETTRALFPYSCPSLHFQHHYAHHYRCQKVARSRLNSRFDRGALAASVQGKREGGDAQVSTQSNCEPGRGEVRTPLHPGGPHRCPHYASPCSSARGGELGVPSLAVYLSHLASDCLSLSYREDSTMWILISIITRPCMWNTMVMALYWSHSGKHQFH